MSQIDPSSQKAYWEQASSQGYARCMYSSDDFRHHITSRLWSLAVEIAHQLGVKPDAHVLDLGCGDGTFANRVLAREFRAVDGLDFTDAGIKRANAESPRPDVRFDVCDLTRADLKTLPHYDGAFLIAILHHVKTSAPSIIRSLREITPRVVVMEPNGNNLMRKLLELTPSYRAAGEDSFRTRELAKLFEAAGYRTVVWRRLNLFPNFTPNAVFKALGPLEPFFEATPGLRALCTVNMYGFAV